MAEASQKLLLATFRNLLASGDFSDFSITCGSDVYKVHKNIVSARTGFIATAIKFGGKETEENTLDLSAEEAATIKLLVQYLYEADYEPIFSTFTDTTNAGNNKSPQTARHTCSDNPRNFHCKHYNEYRQVCPHHHCGRQCNYNCTEFICDKCTTIEGDVTQLLLHAKMYEMADKYDVVGLKALSKEKFQWACLKFWDEPEFAQAACHAYTTTPDHDKGLRNIVSSTLSNHMSLLLKEEVEGLMVKFNGLAFDILLAKAKEAGWCNK